MDAMREAVVSANEKVSYIVLFSKTQLKPGEGFFMMRTPQSSSSQHTTAVANDTIHLFSEYSCELIPFALRGMMFRGTVNMEAVVRFNLDADTTGADNSFLRSGRGITPENFRDKFSENMPIYKKYDTHLVDSLLRKELQAHSIRDDFHFAYINADNDSVEYQTPTSEVAAFLQSPLKQRLTDNAYFSHPYDIVMYFDNNNALILSGMRAMLILSALVIIILLLSFYRFIRIIFKQRKLSELKNDFVNNMTHEFKTPLANISLVLETLSEKGFSDEKHNAHMLRILGQEAERLHDNIEKVLQVARFERDKIQLHLVKVDINQILQNALSAFDVVVAQRCIEIHSSIQTTQPYLMADETHLMNLISNLIDNAIKYSALPTVINITTWNTTKGVYFSINDNGQGISWDAQKKVFDTFYREPQGNVHTIKGFGLGLSYVKSVVEAHHGKISLKSQPSIGSEFEIFLPYGN